MFRSTLHQQETRPPDRSKSSQESGQRLGTNNIPARSLGLNKRRTYREHFGLLWKLRLVPPQKGESILCILDTLCLTVSVIAIN